MKYVFTLFTLFSFQLGLAQIAITQSDAPVVGESWSDFIDDRVGIHTVGPAGANQTWDYSTNFVVQDTDYVNFVAPSSLWPPLNTYFPNSNLAFENPIDSMVTYIKVQANGIFADGSYIYAPSAPIDSLDYDPDLLFLPLPFTFNDLRTHNAKFEIVAFDTSLNATLKFISYTISEFHGDAYGSLTIPPGTFPNILRIRNLTQSIDSTFIDTAGTGNFIFVNTSGIDTSISYQHVKNGPPAILFTLEVLADDMTVEEAFYTTVLTTSVNNISPNENSGYVYPNPVMNDVFHIRIEHDNAYELKLFRIDGKQIYRTSVQSINDLKLQLPLSGGSYLYNIFGKDGKLLDSGTFNKIR